MKGKCHCGEIKFELMSELSEVYRCNCRDCQILSGSEHHLLGIVDCDSIKIVSGKIVEYKNPTESGNQMTRNFCGKCSTPIYIESTRFPDIKMVLVSTLEDPEVLEPSFEIWAQSKYSWANKQCNIKEYLCGVSDEQN